MMDVDAASSKESEGESGRRQWRLAQIKQAGQCRDVS